MKKELILGLDISTSVVGYTILDRELQLHDTGYVSLKQIKGLVQKTVALKEQLEPYVGLINGVAIEEPLVMFKEGFSRAQVLSLLSQFNGMGQLLAFTLYNQVPFMYNVSTARKLAFPDMKFPVGSNRKEIVRNRVAMEYPQIDWLYKPKAIKPDGSPQMKDEMYDLADSLVIAKCHVISLNKQQ